MSDGLEIHSILEFGDEPVSGLWWVLSPSGESPPIRAGAAAVILHHKNNPQLDEKIIITGGATPDGFIENCTELNLLSGEWKRVASTGFTARYEHAMITTDNTLSVLLGSSTTEAQAQHLNGDTWEKSEFTGAAISSRTVAQQCWSANKLYIWSGGTPSGPCSDSSVYIVSNTDVLKQKLSGEVPPGTQEYGCCANEEFMFIHGGLTAVGTSTALYRINLKTFRSKCCTIQDDPIGPLAMHKMVHHDGRMFLYGGLTGENTVSDELWELKPNENWSSFTARKCEFETKPTPRLAFNFHVINLPLSPKISTSTEQEPPSSGNLNIQPIDDWKVTIDGSNVKSTAISRDIDISQYTSKPVFFIHGGCDAEGEFFNDVYVAAIPQ